MQPADLFRTAFYLFVLAPAVATVLAFKGPRSVWPIARGVLLLGWLGYAAGTVACLWYAFAKPQSGIGNGVFLLVAIPIALFALIGFGVWRAARRHGYVQSLPPAERRVEELVDIERGLEVSRESLARHERKLDSFWISSEERDRLRDAIDLLKRSIAKLEEERAKRL